MKKVLLAELSELACSCLTKVFRDGWEVYVETNGDALYDRILTLQPDAFVFGVDKYHKLGVKALEEMYPDKPPVVMVLADRFNNCLIDALDYLNVNAALRIPFNPSYVRKAVDKMHNAYLYPPSKMEQILTYFQIKSHLTGYRCLTTAITRFAESPTKLMKEIYPEVARECHLNNASCVEHAIRVAIKRAWEVRDPWVWAHYFPKNKEEDVDLPTNKVFISTIAKYI